MSVFNEAKMFLDSSNFTHLQRSPLKNPYLSQTLDQIHGKHWRVFLVFRLKSLKTRLNVFLNVFREGDGRGWGRLSSGIIREGGSRGFIVRLQLSQASACFVVFAFVCFLWIVRVEKGNFFFFFFRSIRSHAAGKENKIIRNNEVKDLKRGNEGL